MIEGPNINPGAESYEASEEHKKIMACTSFDGLYAVLQEIGSVQGSTHEYLPTELKKRIERVRHGHRGLLYVTQTHGIRTKVEELLPNDPVYKKYSSTKYNKYA